MFSSDNPSRLISLAVLSVLPTLAIIQRPGLASKRIMLLHRSDLEAPYSRNVKLPDYPSTARSEKRGIYPTK
jgi:hypothetical protein